MPLNTIVKIIQPKIAKIGDIILTITRAIKMLKINLKYFAITYHVLIYNAKIYIFFHKTKSIYKKKIGNWLF